MSSIDTLADQNIKLGKPVLKLSSIAKRRRIEKTNNLSRMKNTKINLNKVGFVFPQFSDKIFDVKKLVQQM